MNRFNLGIMAIFAALLILSCSGSSPESISPDPHQNPELSADRSTSTAGSSGLWGLWDIEWNSGTEEFEITPLRSAELACNVVKFIDGSPSNLVINILSIDPEPDYTDFLIDVGIQHPFPGLDKFTGFDVLGVFMGQGSSIYPGPGGFTMPGLNDQRILNPDGYTRRFNAPEFTGAGEIMPLQGYYPGSKGTPGYTPTAVLNPYKYFADGLTLDDDALDFLMSNPESRGAFSPGSVNHRCYNLRFPHTTGIKFQYAVIANWELNANHPDPPNSLDDFPINANSEETVVVDILDYSSAYFIDENNFGGDICFEITVWDWSATCDDTMEEYGIKIYCSAWSGAFEVDMTPTEKGDHYHKFLASKPVEVLTSYDLLPVFIEIYYPGLNYANPFGVPNNAAGTLASYFLTVVNVNEEPAWIYGIGDGAYFHWADDCDNSMLITNMLNLPLTGAFADNDKVVWHEGHSKGNVNPSEFGSLVTGLGYTYEYIPDTPFVPLDVTGLKMLVIFTPHPPDEPNYFTPEEVQGIKDMVNGGGIVVILIEYSGAYNDTVILDKLIDDLGVDFSCPTIPVDPYGQYAVDDFTEDPITEGLTKLCGSAAGCFDIAGDAVSLVRNDEGLTLICKSPIEN